eukprot:TRINITY_DN2759_c0_g1_i2.p1 TRINITY_DN2759_c0_g1~~TRINITY_DN2759_c0_g1_i2.p1  ORF type:complete len:372 (+),score=65.37 TRINITY_DN2759_c0_g1_i2:32-1147(+)
MIGDDDAPTPATTESESDCTCLISLRAAESFFRACGIDPVQWLRRAGVHDVWPDVGLGCYAYFADGGRGELCAARWEGDDPWKYAKWPAAPARPTQLLVGRATRGCWEALSRPMPGDRRACVVCCPLERREDVCRFNPDGFRFSEFEGYLYVLRHAPRLHDAWFLTWRLPPPRDCDVQFAAFNDFYFSYTSVVLYSPDTVLQRTEVLVGEKRSTMSGRGGWYLETAFLGGLNVIAVDRDLVGTALRVADDCGRGAFDPVRWRGAVVGLHNACFGVDNAPSPAEVRCLGFVLPTNFGDGHGGVLYFVRCDKSTVPLPPPVPVGFADMHRLFWVDVDQLLRQTLGPMLRQSLSNPPVWNYVRSHLLAHAEFWL